MSMTTIRLFVTDALLPGAELPASPAQAHYLGNVMRRSVGDAVRLFNGRDGEWLARLVHLRRDQAVFQAEVQERPQAPEPDLWLAFAPLKRDTTHIVVEKATELGVSVLLPVMTARTNAERVNLPRLQAIATEAAEQCERLSVPEVRPPQRLEALLRDWPAERSLAVGMERVEAAPIRAPAGGFLVGPEGGFTGGELDALHRHPFVTPVTLGPRILRAETAAIVGLALLQAHAPHF